MTTIQYRNYTITYDPPPIPTRAFDWHYVHNDFDGAPDAHDTRGGSASSLAEAKREIDALENGA
jgi:hypothetical protein